MINRKHLQVWESKRDAAVRKGKPVPEYKPRQVSQATKAQHLSFIRSLLRAAANDWGWIKQPLLSKPASLSVSGYGG
ncbi:hypothetical protein EAO10_00145 [Klebsiella pneumoniae]|nr:hypothetical protein EAO10_00145 [Klebsiella pneumoniae]